MSISPDALFEKYTHMIKDVVCCPTNDEEDKKLLRRYMKELFVELIKSGTYTNMMLHIIINGRTQNQSFKIPESLNDGRSDVEDPHGQDTRQNAIPVINAIAQIPVIILANRQAISGTADSIFKLVRDTNPVNEPEFFERRKYPEAYDMFRLEDRLDGDEDIEN